VPAGRARPGRIRLLAIGTVAVMGVLAMRAGYLGTVKAGELSGMAAGQQLAAVEVPAPRGAIVTSDGRELAVDRLAVSVSATPYLVKDPVWTAERIAPAVGLPVAETERRLRARGGFVSLARNVSLDRARYLRKLDAPGIELADSQQRVYPLRRVGSQLVGLTDDYGVGLSGLEKARDRALTGAPGRRVEARDPFGRPLRIVDDRQAEPGRSVRLTVDSVIQDRTERILAATRSRFGAHSAMAIVMRPRDGAILAMATVPRFDPNDRESLTADAERNRPVTDTFEPGSTFKLVTVAGALQEGLVTPETSFYLPSVLSLYDRELEDSHPREPVTWTVSEILARSSNVGTVLVGQKLGAARLQSWIERFGFGEETGVDFPGEVPGIVLPLDKWSGTSILNIPIGQGVAVTLTQLARAYAAVANGGYLVTPHLVEGVGGREVRATRGRRILEPATAAALDRMLRGVVAPDGTGSEAQVEGYEVAGKTGTANKIDPATGTYDERYVASFVGYLPADRPELLVAVVVDEPTNGAYYGGEVAAPAFEQISEFALQHLGIAP
jgi:cell division protein FtsI/penicillin-binding protein 2